MNISQENRVLKAVEWVEKQMAKEAAMLAKMVKPVKVQQKKKDKTPIEIKMEKKKADTKAVEEAEQKAKKDEKAWLAANQTNDTDAKD